MQSNVLHSLHLHDNAVVLRSAPIGSNKREIATSLGYGANDIDAMVRDGVLYSPT
jgi:hypothetical protein